MTSMSEESGTALSNALGVQNISEPLRFTNVESFAGFAVEAANAGQNVKICTKLALTSDDSLFHRLAESLEGVIAHMAQQSGTFVDLRRGGMILLVLKPDKSVELWIDAAAVSIQCVTKRAIAARTVVFENDIADVTAMSFPCVSIGDKDKVLCLFRERWSFGLAFDFNPAGKLDLDAFQAALGTLYRRLRYRHLYEVIDKPAVFDKLIASGWFPFAELITTEFRDLAQHVEAGFDISEIEEKIVAAFDETRLGHLFERWAAKPHFAVKGVLLKEALAAFAAKRPASTIKIILTEIEGVLNDAYRATHGGQGAKLKELLAFAEGSAAQRAGGSDTLLLPVAFGRYLSAHTFANFDPVARTGTAGSRHAVGHGAAAQDTYTMPHALQAILTLDQLAFYT
jgi:hypothetical protein